MLTEFPRTLYSYNLHVFVPSSFFQRQVYDLDLPLGPGPSSSHTSMTRWLNAFRCRRPRGMQKEFEDFGVKQNLRE